MSQPTPTSAGPQSDVLLSSRVFPRAFLVGLFTGLLAVGFRLTLEFIDLARTEAFYALHPYGVLGFFPAACLAVVLVVVATALVRGLCPQAAGSGIPHLKTVLETGTWTLNSLQLIFVKFFSGALAIASGLCLGREGPTVQMGAAVGALYAGRGYHTPTEWRSLIVMGAGAGLAAAFNAPLAGIVFILEELRVGLKGATLTAALAASLTADVVTRGLVDALPVFHIRTDVTAPLAALPLFALLGVIASVGGWAFNAALLRCQAQFRALTWSQAILKAMLAGVMIAIVGWIEPVWVGGGEHFTRVALVGESSIVVLVLVLFVRFVLTLGSYAVGTAGGLFAPILVFGAVTGLIVGQVAHASLPIMAPDPVAYAVAGMAGWFVATVRAPLTGIVLMVEMTGNYGLILPLMGVTFPAMLVGDWLGTEPLYDALQKQEQAFCTPSMTSKPGE